MFNHFDWIVIWWILISLIWLMQEIYLNNLILSIRLFHWIVVVLFGFFLFWNLFILNYIFFIAWFITFSTFLNNLIKVELYVGILKVVLTFVFIFLDVEPVEWIFSLFIFINQMFQRVLFSTNRWCEFLLCWSTIVFLVKHVAYSVSTSKCNSRLFSLICFMIILNGFWCYLHLTLLNIIFNVLSKYIFLTFNWNLTFYD